LIQKKEISMQKTQNRWLVALGAVGVHLPLGSVYAYSVLTLPLNNLHGWTKSDVTMAFSLAILLLGFSAAFLGPTVERIGPKKAVRLCAAFYTLGISGAGLGIHLGSLPLFILCYGFVGGIGLGIGYIAPVPTLLKWFPDRRGMASGMAVMGFGFGSLVFGPVMVAMMKFLPVWAVLYTLAGVYGTMIFLASCTLTPPPEGWSPTPGTARTQATPQKPKGMLADLTAKEAFRTPRFYYLWLMMFMNIGCGISVISVASPMAQEMTGMTALQAAGLVGMMGLLNGIGRFFWASVSDYIGRTTTYIAFFVLQFGIYLLLARTTAQPVFHALVLLMISCYGGGFACLPAFISDIFGVRQLGAILGAVLTAWGIAGIVGPTMTAQLVAHTGNYTLILHILAGAMAAIFAVSLLMLTSVRRLRKESETKTK
jgi:OFA family oxalate/formate antiporter-like MFS transporter